MSGRSEICTLLFWMVSSWQYILLLTVSNKYYPDLIKLHVQLRSLIQSFFVTQEPECYDETPAGRDIIAVVLTVLSGIPAFWQSSRMTGMTPM
jgi:hypothetical protein